VITDAENPRREIDQAVPPPEIRFPECGSEGRNPHHMSV
jgi:hypothetical protein